MKTLHAKSDLEWDISSNDWVAQIYVLEIYPLLRLQGQN